MSPKIKMTDSYEEHDDEIIELTEDELKEILADVDFEDEGDYEEIRSFRFSNPDPYFKVEPRPDDAPSGIFPLTSRATSWSKIRLPFGYHKSQSWMKSAVRNTP